ncbi:LysE family translocator [Acinetobacter puyangensis]|uniref:Threonine/homoserine/homoserine lactone efflux protein n=1 Tax=Acinetobacter puyangensis TaxID=1096779 RepID=A0A240E6Z8_9GAMM|nr:LysE family transporter [Acinetobacter puyangensis]SNX43969.1 Threonine/homoserine/homoserine lactone efflux protein [Acinetobacter puyangensis]
MEIFLYTLSVMYSPGPVNFMGLNAGLTGQFSRTFGFFIGVGCSMLVLFIIFGYVGEAVLPHDYLHFVALLGALYVFYLAYKMISSNLDLKATQHKKTLNFWDGFLIQTLNPKAILVILPVTTIMFPTAHITGSMILMISFLISLGAAGAPFLYAFAGTQLHQKITNPIWFNRINTYMGLLLIISGIFMLHDFLKGMHFL